MQCWLYSIRVQIIMSHFFHIKKKSIIINNSAFNVQDSIRERPQKYKRNAPARAWSDSLRKLQFSKLRPKNWLNQHTQSLRGQWLQFAFASIFPLRWVVCCVFTDYGLYIINIMNQRFYLASFVRFYLSSATFNTFNTIWNYATF